MQSIWKISLGTWLALLGDYPSAAHRLRYRADGRTEVGRFHEQNTGCWTAFIRPHRGAQHLTRMVRDTRLSSAIFLQACGYQTLTHAHMKRSPFPSPGLVVPSVPSDQSKPLLSMGHGSAGLLPSGLCCDDKRQDVWPSFRSNCYPENKEGCTPYRRFF